MKNVLLICAIFVAFTSCKTKIEKKAIDYAIIKGMVHNHSLDTIIIENTKTFEEFFLPVDSSGHFIDTINIDAKFYRLSFNGRNFLMPLFRGMNLNFEFQPDNFYDSLKISGKGASIVTSFKNFRVWDMENIESTYYAMNHLLNEQTFLFQSDSLIKAKITVLNGLKDSVPNDLFKDYKQYLRYEYLSWLDGYEKSCRYFGTNKDFKVSEAFPNVLDSIDFMDSSLVDNWNYTRLIESSISSVLATKYDWEEVSYCLSYLSYIDTMNLPKLTKMKLIDNKLLFFLKYEKISVSELADKLKSYDLNEKQHELIDSLYQIRVNTMPGSACTDFEFEDQEGKKYSLETFKGKYLVLDFWATWCSPCIKEIPDFNVLKEKFKDENIEFVSVCCAVWKEDTKASWIDKMKELKMEGLQLFTDQYGKSGFFKNLGINGLPHFVIIDPNGNIVDANASRPSSNMEKKINEILN